MNYGKMKNGAVILRRKTGKTIFGQSLTRLPTFWPYCHATSKQSSNLWCTYHNIWRPFICRRRFVTLSVFDPSDLGPHAGLYGVIYGCRGGRVATCGGGFGGGDVDVVQHEEAGPAGYLDRAVLVCGNKAALAGCAAAERDFAS